MGAIGASIGLNGAGSSGGGGGTVDGVTITGAGTSGSPWKVAPAGLWQAFSYTVLGSEPDLQHLVIALPNAEAAATYDVFPAQATHTNLLGMAVNVSGKTTTQFVLTLSAVATTADVFSFFVIPHT